ncbi:MAG: DUF1667 domain-containing protein [Erysipelotrichaceae bacterium]|nr:DUF1667 domain-containing protein [Erysipelotrichaceae bacterium]
MKLVCINCPRGCHLLVEKQGDQIKVEGNACPRGVTYATNEMTNPLRTLTTTVPILSDTCQRLPVITSKPIPRDLQFEVIRALKDVRVNAPVHYGEVIVKDVLNLNSDIIASKTILK